MAADFIIKQHDTFPYLESTLSDNSGQIDLTNAEKIKFFMKSASTLIEGLCEYPEPTVGKVIYKWAKEDTSVAGSYQAEFQITWKESKGIESVPNEGYNTIEVVKTQH